ncbi:MAG: hypothetical protein JW828_06420 [Sedimentisphaerales bacterium]|nr:hypothetical protein [Sedimentisphaerales bacterium]
MLGSQEQAGSGYTPGFLFLTGIEWNMNGGRHMEAQNTSKTTTPVRKSKWTRKFLIAAGGLFCLVALFFFLTPVLISSTAGKRFVLGKVGAALEATVDADSLSMSWFDGITLSGLHFIDKIGKTKVSVQRLSIKPVYLALLRGKVLLAETTIDTPRAQFHLTPAVPQEKSNAPGVVGPAPAPVALPIGMAGFDLNVTDGEVSILVEKEAGQSQSVTFGDIQSKLALHSPGKESRFQLAAAVMDNGFSSRIAADGKINTDASQEWSLKGTSGQVNIQIDKLELGSLQPLMALFGKQVDAEGTVNADVDLELNQGRAEKLIAKADIANFRSTAKGKELALTKPVILNTDITRKGDQYRIDALQVQSSFFALQGKGGADQLEYSLTADLASSQAFLAPFVDLGEISADGDFHAAGKVRFEQEGFGISGQAEVKRLSFQKSDIKTDPENVVIDLAARIDTKNQAVEIASARIRSDAATVQASNGSLTYGNEGVSFTLAAGGTADLVKVLPFLDLFKPLPEGLQLAGKAQANVQAGLKEGIYSVEVKDGTVENFRLVRPEEKPFLQDKITLAAKASFDTAARGINVQDLSLQGVQGDSRISITKGRFLATDAEGKRKVQGQLEAEYDLETVTALAGDTLPPDLELVGKRTTNLSFESEYPTDKPDQFMQNMKAQTTLKLDGTKYKGLHFTAGDADLKMAEGKLHISIPQAKANEGTVSFQGYADLISEPRILYVDKPVHVVQNLQVNEQMGRELLMYLNPIFVDQGNMTGILDFQCDRMAIPLQSGYPDKLALAGTIRMDNVRLQSRGLIRDMLSHAETPDSLPAALLATPFVLENGRLSYESMEMHLDKYPVGFSGSIGLNNTMDLRAKLPYRIDMTSFRLRTVKIGEDTSGRIELPLEGPLNAPQIRLDRLVEELGRKLLQQKLGVDLGDLFKR